MLLPFAVQTVHAFEKHEQSDLSSQVTLKVNEHETDCSFFHYKINNSFFDFSTKFLIVETNFISENILSNEVEITSIKLFSKSSRAPPFLLF